MPDSISFSDGVDRLLAKIRPYGRLESCHPPTLNDPDSRRSPGESLQQWFIRLVNLFCGGEPKLVALEDNLAVFVRLAWRGRTQLTYANVQTLCAACDLEEYFLGKPCDAAYLRLDFDYKTLGDPFSHPLAHIHFDGELSPRFALDGGISGNLVMDYLEFLYRTYVPAKWLQWVQREWAKEFEKTANENDIDPLPTIVRAFASSQFSVLRNYAADANRIKRFLRVRKDKLFDLHMIGADREILEYPLAR